MKFSYAWLQTYSKEPLLPVAKLAEVVTLNAFEVEEMTRVGGDDVLDIKVLPNRAHDALGHRGMARDICALVGNTFVDPNEYYKGEGDAKIVSPSIHTDDTHACPRFMSVRIDNVKVTESPAWLKERLVSIGQKSINSIVDITNYVQFSLNKPMHAYDANLISGNTLVARFAKKGEKLTTLDEKELNLEETTLVIADSDKPLGLAGIKGGKFSGISSSTTSIILESANFNPALIRKTSQKYGIRTDASKRFENEISDTLCEDGLRMTIALVERLNPKARVSLIVDVWNRNLWSYAVAVSAEEVNAFLGTGYSSPDIKDALTRLGFEVQESTAVEMIRQTLLSLPDATYKNPSTMRQDAPHYFSCSSLISYIFSGIWQPSISIDKYVYGEKIEEKDRTWGDLVFSNTGEGKIRYESVSFLPGTKVESGIDHVGLYIEDDKVTHISQRTGKIVTEAISESASFKSGIRYARIMDVQTPRLFVTVPPERLDVRIKEDLIEEVARIKGLSTIVGVLPKLGRVGVPHKRLYYENRIRNILYGQGFSEIMTYSFGDIGEVEIIKGAAMDKTKLRTELFSGVEYAFQMNMLNAPLLSIQTVKMYEFGNVFTKGDERRHLAIVVDDGKKKSSFSDEMDMLLSQIKRDLGVTNLEYETKNPKPYVIELDFDTLIESLPEPTSYELLTSDQDTVSYKAVSPYPFIVRDIAVWTPVSTTWEDIHALALQIDSPLIVRIYCFDTFSKEMEGMMKTSYAFRVVLQSSERTLTDAEANSVADAIYSRLKEKGYEIR